MHFYNNLSITEQQMSDLDYQLARLAKEVLYRKMLDKNLNQP